MKYFLIRLCTKCETPFWFKVAACKASGKLRLKGGIPTASFLKTHPKKGLFWNKGLSVKCLFVLIGLVISLGLLDGCAVDVGSKVDVGVVKSPADKKKKDASRQKQNADRLDAEARSQAFIPTMVQDTNEPIEQQSIPEDRELPGTHVSPSPQRVPVSKPHAILQQINESYVLFMLGKHDASKVYRCVGKILEKMASLKDKNAHHQVSYLIMDRDSQLHSYYIVDKYTTHDKLTQFSPIYHLQIVSRNNNIYIVLYNEHGRLASAAVSKRILSNIQKYL